MTHDCFNSGFGDAGDTWRSSPIHAYGGERIDTHRLEHVLDEIAKKRERAAMRESVPHERVEIALLKRRAQRERARNHAGNHLATLPTEWLNLSSQRSARLSRWHPCVRAIMIAQIHRCLGDRSLTAIGCCMAMWAEIHHLNRISTMALKTPSYTTFCRHLRCARAQHSASTIAGHRAIFAVASCRHNATALKADKA